MEHGKSQELTLEKDLNNLEDQQKGKQVAGKQTDIELTITTMKNDILAAQVSVRGDVLAATDQNILGFLINDKNLARGITNLQGL
jgi:hypothetical protein